MDEYYQLLDREYQEAAHTEENLRVTAYLDISHKICGIEVKQLTLYHLAYLDNINNFFVVKQDRAVQDYDVVNFLWIVSAEWKLRDAQAHLEFTKTKCTNIDYEQAFIEITKYLEKEMIDSLETKIEHDRVTGKRMAPRNCWLTQYIDILASEYGWTVEYIKHLPIAIVLQLVRVVEARHYAESGGKDDPFLSYSEKVMMNLRDLRFDEERKRMGMTNESE